MIRPLRPRLRSRYATALRYIWRREGRRAHPLSRGERRLTVDLGARHGVARAVARIRIRLPGCATVDAFSCHLPSGGDSAQRSRWVNAFKQWTASLARPEIVAGDFNDVPGSAFDYIFSAGALTTESATILPAKISDHRAVVATFRMNGRS